MSIVKNEPRGHRHPLSIAPMMDCTDRHYRYMMRFITRCTLLYTEMITASAILRGHTKKLLDFSKVEPPLALQLGGSDPTMLKEAAMLGQDWGYQEINLNVGCPSNRVKEGKFGACLMAEPELVAEAVFSMREAVNIPVTVKHRIGIDHLDRYEDLHHFVEVVEKSGCDKFIVHARIAWLQGLSPKENRTVPPIRYQDIKQLKQDFPHLTFEVNGEIKTLGQAKQHISYCDGVMIGRAAYDNPYLFWNADQEFYGKPNPDLSRREVALSMIEYLQDWMDKGYSPHLITRHILGLYRGVPNGRLFRKELSGQQLKTHTSASSAIHAAIAHVELET